MSCLHVLCQHLCDVFLYLFNLQRVTFVVVVLVLSAGMEAGHKFLRYISFLQELFLGFQLCSFSRVISLRFICRYFSLGLLPLGTYCTI